MKDKSEHKNEDKNEYKIQIDKDIYSVHHHLLTGRELLEIAKKSPIDQFAIYLKVVDGPPRRIKLDEKVDLMKPGVERFLTLPLDQTEGFDGRQDFSLPRTDLDWLYSTGLQFELVSQSGILRIVLYGFEVPNGYNHCKVDVNVRIDPGYPDTQIDMVYVYPPLVRTDGIPIRALASDDFDGKNWQRWSRHRTPANPWRSGLDNLSTHFNLVEEWFARELRKS